MQKSFAFVDTEANIEHRENKQFQTFQLGSAIYWDREKDEIEEQLFDSVGYFWDKILSRFNENNKKILLFAHNMGYDFRLLDGVKQLEARGWTARRYYVKSRTFILEYNNGPYVLCIWDTYNYVQASLEEIGKTVGLPKMGHFDDHVTTKELSEYCLNDTRIIYLFIRRLVEFLEKYELSKLMPTVAGLSFNMFRHCFYDKKKEPIYIHDWRKAIKLERESYSGGITDCFRVGQIKETTYKLDINSMYPAIMKEKTVPDKLLFYSCNPEEDLLKMYHGFKEDHLIIARCKISLPEKYAYILNRSEIGNETKSILAYGEMEVVKCSPELNFIEKYGKILSISEIAIYRPRKIFEEFIDFFYEKRLEYKSQGDKVNEKFCKIILNSLYGKWAQRAMEQVEINPGDQLYQDFLITKEDEDVDGEVDKEIIDTLGEKTRRYKFTELGNRIFSEELTDNNSKDSFVAISSFITSYARMMLVEHILTAGRENVFYMDTDSLFVNHTGMMKLKPYIHPDKLGFLKIEDVSNKVIINKPKDYTFGEEKKLKGVRKGSKPIRSNDKEDVYIQDRWEGFNTAIQRGHFNVVIIESYEKKVSKKYDKGVVLANGKIRPFKRGIK